MQISVVAAAAHSRPDRFSGQVKFLWIQTAAVQMPAQQGVEAGIGKRHPVEGAAFQSLVRGFARVAQDDEIEADFSAQDADVFGIF